MPNQRPSRVAALRDNLALQRRAFEVCKEAGMIGGQSPLATIKILRNVRVLGAVGAAIGNSATKFADTTAIIDERGEITYAELDASVNALANHLTGRGFKAGDGLAILARNHRGLPISIYAGAKVGARIVLLNTDFAGPQIREVASREGMDFLIYDDEYAQFLDGVEPPLGRLRAWADTPGVDTVEAVVAAGDPSTPKRPAMRSKLVVLTSGTTGSPKGAPRTEPKGLLPIAAILDKLNFRSGDVMELCAPMFHSLGMAFMLLGIGLGNTLVIRRRFDPIATLDSIERNGSTTMVAVPVMLARILDEGKDELASRDLSSIRGILAGGSQLGGELAERTQAAFGLVLHNLYGSTEVAYATMAQPADLAAAPDCVGKVCLGTVVRILDDRGNEVPAGATGRIFVRNAIPFDGYTGGGHKEVIDGLMSTGDVGHFDSEGRLFVDGRDDEMIVSGGENVFPREIEELLAHHEDVADVAAIGVPDEKFGERLRAFVVRREGADIGEDAIKDYVRARLARYKVPREVVFLDELPRNATGKILKRELKLIEV